MKLLMRKIISLLFFLLFPLQVFGAGDFATKQVYQLSIKGVIGPATSDYIERAIDTAILQHAELLVILMDTPGGLDSAMRVIIKNIMKSPVPVAVYVTPAGARAASAGTYILYASHIAAMSPGTNLGAATPVTIGGISYPKPKPDEKQDEKQKDKLDKSVPGDGKTTLERKAINDAVAYIRGLAQLRGRNEKWAEEAVRQAASLPATDALKKNVINIIASDVTDLLHQLDGREILIHGKKYKIQTSGLAVKEINPDWRNDLLSVITNPNIAYILMLVGIYGLIFEFSNPGAIVPGTIGAICLLLALYSFQLLPINYAGMALIILGIALMVGEAYEPSFGILGIGGVIAFVIGSVILMDTEAPGFGIDLSVILSFAVSSVFIFVVVIGMAMKARRRPVVSGLEELIGSHAEVLDDFNQAGTVNVHSENWSALTKTSLKKGQVVKVTAVNGLTLEVEPLMSSEQESEQ